MISILDGNLELRGQKFAIINVAGVGYKVFAGVETLNKLTSQNDQVNPSTSLPSTSLRVKLWTHQYVRENTLELYGFLSFAELDLFETLIAISGIGPKGALGILAIAPIDTLKKAIAAGDVSYLTRVSGIGRKTAEKIILELREKMAGRSDVSAPELKEEADALDALISLGYSRTEAKDALADSPKEAISAEDRIKTALKKLGKTK